MLGSFPLLLESFVEEGGDFTFSSVIKEGDSFYLVYKYSFSPKEQKTLENSWFELEELALNKKRFDSFDLWIKDRKEKLYVLVQSF